MMKTIHRVHCHYIMDCSIKIYSTQQLAHNNYTKFLDYSLGSCLGIFLGILVTDSGLKSILLRSRSSSSETPLFPGVFVGGVTRVSTITSSCVAVMLSSSRIIYIPKEDRIILEPIIIKLMKLGSFGKQITMKYNSITTSLFSSSLAKSF